MGSVSSLLAFLYAAVMAGLLICFGQADTAAGLLLLLVAAVLQSVVLWNAALTWLTTRALDTAGASRPESMQGVSIDAYVTVCGEPLDVVVPVIKAVRDMCLPHDTWVLDDAASAQLRDVCTAEGVSYLSRPTPERGKAGNINHALARTEGELVAIFDADHHPDSRFLLRTVGHFEDERVAFVQTPQSYLPRRGLPARGAREAQQFFYRHIMPGKARARAAICVGTNVVFRRAALEQMGGMYEGSLSEDVHTSLRLHALGHRSVYVEEVLAHGLPPQKWQAYLRQQRRWARGAFEILFSAHLWRRGGLTARQRLQYSLLGTYYLSSISSLLMSLFPGVYLLLRESPLTAHPGILLALIVTATVTVALANRAQSGGYGVASAVAHLVAGPVYVMALLDVIVRRRAGWTPTHREGASLPGTFSALPHLGMAAVNLVAVAFGAVSVAARLGHPEPAAALGMSSADDLWTLLPLAWCLTLMLALLLPTIGRLHAAGPVRSRRRHVAVFCSAALVIAVAGAKWSAVPLERRPPRVIASMVWREDFSRPAGARPSSQDWTFASGHHYPGGPPNWGTGEIQEYVSDPANLRTDGRGNLEITATADEDGHYRSARIETRRSDFFPPPDGTLRIQARAALPAAQGSWATFWALGASFRDNLRWPESGEIDVIEYRGSRPDEVYGVLHCLACGEPLGRRARHRDPDGLANTFHTYTVDWRSRPRRIDWYVDGRLYQSMTPEKLDDGTWPFHQPVFLLLNLAVGGHWPGAPVDSAYPATLKVDYVEARTCRAACPPLERSGQG